MSLHGIIPFTIDGLRCDKIMETREVRINFYINYGLHLRFDAVSVRKETTPTEIQLFFHSNLNQSLTVCRKIVDNKVLILMRDTRGGGEKISLFMNNVIMNKYYWDYLYGVEMIPQIENSEENQEPEEGVLAPVQENTRGGGGGGFGGGAFPSRSKKYTKSPQKKSRKRRTRR
jgi:hypothetical protein